MISNYEARRWTKSENIGKPINSKFFESHACFSPDGNTIYFTSNRRESLGGMDIFSSTLNEDGEWSEPVNLGQNINTGLNEETPFMCDDGKTLYFSSQGHSTIGGYDIFMSKLQDDGTWSTPEALPYPLNTTDDDLFFFPMCEDELRGYMARHEEDGLGSSDIYELRVQPYEEITEEEVEEEIEEITEESETVAETEEEPQEEPVEEVAEEEIEEVAEKEIEEVTEEQQEEITETEAEKPAEADQPMYSLKPVYFAFDSYELSQSARSRLDEVAEMMKAYQEIKLEIQGHTDAMGPEVYNQYLSEKRAESAKDYLIEKGINPERLTAKGFSEEKPVALNQNPDGSDAFRGRKLNRRVEYDIDPGIVDDKVTIEEVPVPEDLKIDD
jgi:outer membrane protein OmpA-like peptidoglycan-associated protein